MEQKKWSFDEITKNKIIKGGLIAFSGAGALALLSYVGALQIEDPLMASMVAFAVPFGVNLVREWMKGK